MPVLCPVLYVVVKFKVFLPDLFGSNFTVEETQKLVKLVGRKIRKTELAVERLRQLH